MYVVYLTFAHLSIDEYTKNDEIHNIFSSVQSHSRVRLFATPCTAALQASLSMLQLPELTQTHVHWVSDAIQPSHPLSSPSPPSFNLTLHQGFSKESALHIRWPIYWSFSFSISPPNEHSGLISFRLEWLDLIIFYKMLVKVHIIQIKNNKNDIV